MIIVITGPTCLGKSETAVKIAEIFNAEIVNGDAFQCYKELNIGVAKPGKELLGIVPHHLYSFIEANHDYSIAEYQKNIREKIAELLKKNKNIIIVGGSGLYIRSALYDYEFQEQKTVDMSKYLKMSDRDLHDELRKIDPLEAEKIHVNNRKRVLRAIEIYLSSGESKSNLISKQEHKLLYDAKFFVREMPREELYARINRRVDEMINKGLVNEVKTLLDKYGDKPHSLQAIGYKELIDYFNGKIALDDAIELIKKNTRNYAKRQITYIRHQFPVEFYKDTNDLINIINKYNY